MRPREYTKLGICAATSILIFLAVTSTYSPTLADAGGTVNTDILLAKGLPTYTPDAWLYKNTVGQSIDVIVEYSTCDQLEAIEYLEVWSDVDQNPKLMVEIIDGEVRVEKGTYKNLLPGKIMFFNIWGQAYNDTSVTSTTLTLKVTMETHELKPEPETKKEASSPTDLTMQIGIALIVVAIAYLIGVIIGKH